uniref:DRBM domain-containing protein n=1 Tax=Stomoxys calcitrans TaxID=35570 RepID=A0A1I8Q683_STOCA
MSSYRATRGGRRSVQTKPFISADTGEAYNSQRQQSTPTQNYQTAPVVQPEKVVQQEQSLPPPSEFPEANPFKENTSDLDESGLVDENGKVKFKKIFASRKKASVRAKEKRIRQNRRLRKSIVPKNALMALNELKGISIGDFVINNNPNGGFIALVTCNNNQYEGRGISKTVAKNNACEKALRDYIIAKMREKPRKALNGNNAQNNVNDEPMETGDGDGEGGGENNTTLDETEDVPMVNLASFAIYKLFSEWENEGYIIPEMHPAAAGNFSDNESMAGTGAKEPKRPPVRNELPPNWEAMHPASLLCYMRPGITYTDKGTIGEKPNILHTLATTVDDEEFEASGRSKKIARRNVAAVACNTLFNTNFEPELKSE